MTNIDTTIDDQKTVLFIVLPYPSHYNTIFGLAEELRRLGWRTIATVSKMTRTHAEDLGFETISWKYLEEIRITKFRQFLAYYIKSRTNTGFRFKRLRQFINHSQNAKKIVHELRPSMIMVDRHLGYYSILMGKKVIIFDTKISSLRQPGIAPFSCDRKPSQIKMLDNVIAWIQWETYNTLLFIGRQASSVALGSTYEMKYLQRECRINRLEWRSTFQPDNFMYDSWKHVPRLLLYPKCFEYPWYKPNNNDTHLWFPGRPNYSLPQAKYESIAKSSNKLIYFSVGTISSNISSVVKLITTLIDIVKSEPEWYLILSVGSLFDRFEDKTSDNHGIWFYRSVDQSYILSLSDLFISHGGFNSVKEAIINLVPMLVYPTNPGSDQPGNGARVEYHGIGLSGRITKINSRHLKVKLGLILDDGRYMQNLRKVKTEFESETVRSKMKIENLCFTLNNVNYEKDS